MRRPKDIFSQPFLPLVTLSFTFFYIFILAQTPLFYEIQLRAVDALFQGRSQMTSASKSLQKIVIIGVDDESYQRLNRPLPWGREVFAVFLENLAKLNPAVVGLDFQFVGKGINEKADQWFAQAIQKNKKVILASVFDEDKNPHLPNELFLRSASSHGYIDKPDDMDGGVRRVKGFMKPDGSAETFFPFPTQLAYAYWGMEPSQHIYLEGKRLVYSTPALKKVSVQIDDKNQWWLSMRYKKGDFSYIPFWKIVAGRVPVKEIEGKIVLVGPTSPLFHDIHPTSLGPLLGVMINANEVLMILDQDFIERFPRFYYALLLIFFTILLTWIFDRFHFISQFVVFVCSEAFIASLSLMVFTKYGLLFETFPLMFIIGATYSIVLFYKGLATFLENETLKRQVIMDGLTGLYGQRYLMVRLAAEFSKHLRAQTEFYFVMVDIDHFKKVNDTYGHERGNEVLLAVANCLKGGVRGYDVAARYGGEEFSLILSSSDEKTALQTVERIRTAVEAHKFMVPGGEFHVTFSAGVCSNRSPGVHSDQDLIHLADQALYQAKNAGRNQVRLHRGA